MKLQGYLIVIVCCLGLAFTNISKKRYLLTSLITPARISFIVGQGVLLLVYPLLGHLADVYLTRYRALKFSLIILTIISFAGLVYKGIDTAESILGNIKAFHHTSTGILLSVGFTAYFIGVGLFEANIIQFGLDQLLEAPTQKLISFIHWYYWAQSVGGLALFYVYEGGVVAHLTLYDSNHTIKSKLIDASVDSCHVMVQILLNTTILIIFCISKKHFYIEKAGLNPFKNIYKVLKYSWKHKVPELRSALTYWEEDIPRRINLGKNKYGGSFTNEEVEDTKTFLRILPLILCLFGYHLAGDGYSATEQLQRTSCPSLPVLLLIAINPQHLTALVTVVGIPLYRLVIIKVIPKVKTVRMLTKMWVGLYLSLLQVVLYIIVVVNYDTSHSWPQHYSNHTKRYIPTHECIRDQLGNSSPLPVDNTYLWFMFDSSNSSMVSLLCLSPWQCLNSSVPRLLALPRGCSLVCGMLPSSRTAPEYTRHSRQPLHSLTDQPGPPLNDEIV